MSRVRLPVFRPQHSPLSEAVLNPRQYETVRLLWEGHLNKQIGAELGVSEGAVKQRLKNIARRLHLDPGLARRVQLALWYERNVARATV